MTSSYPYEVWHYQHMEGRDRDVKVRFVDTADAESTGRMQLRTKTCFDTASHSITHQYTESIYERQFGKLLGVLEDGESEYQAAIQ